ncbi:MAG TPA: glycosyltransferase family 39 protein [Blastocatellia bacterium]
MRGLPTGDSERPAPEANRSKRLGRLRLAEWLGARLPSRKPAELGVVRLALICSAIFLSALGVRLLYWQDTALELSTQDTLSRNMATQYRREARRILQDHTILFPREQIDPGDARLIIHPPGYSIVMAASFRLFGETERPLRWLQVTFDSASSVMVFFIAAELLPLGVALIAALLMALSPHFSYYSLRLSPDSLAVLPVLIAVYLIANAHQRHQPYKLIVAGAMLGLSCWLRANALLLAPFLAVVILILFERGNRLRHAIALIAAAILVVAPITIRNWVVYRRFVPVALPAGVNLVQGIAEMDTDGQFGMPLTDPEVLSKDVEWNDRPDYGGHMWTPDGIERDRTRFAHAFAVIRSHPVWFLGATIRRARFMLSYNESRPRQWPFNTASAPLLSATPPFGHSISGVFGKNPIWSALPADLLAGGRLLSSQAAASIGGESLKLTGDDSDYGDQFSSELTTVRNSTDYVLTIWATANQGHAAAKVVGAGERVLASSNISSGEAPTRKARIALYEDLHALPIAFPTGNSSQVRLVLSNNGMSGVKPAVDVTRVELFELGPTPTLWTRYPRVIISGIQGSLYATWRMLPLIILGVAVLAFARRLPALVILLSVPVYYVVTHAPFSTEYRYVLAIHCFLFIIAAVTLYLAGVLIVRCFRRVRKAGMQSSAVVFDTRL